MGKPIDADALRETRGRLVEGFANTDRQLGALPEPERYEKFIDPILRKVEVDAREAPEPEAKAAPEPEEITKTVDGARITREIVGEFSLKTGEQLSGRRLPQARRRPEGPNTRLARFVFRAIRNAPGLVEWKHRMEKIVMAAQPPEWKAARYMEVLSDFVRLYGNPLDKRRKIMSGAGGKR